MVWGLAPSPPSPLPLKGARGARMLAWHDDKHKHEYEHEHENNHFEPRP